AIYSKKQAYINDFSKAVLPPLVLMGLILSLIVMQPDIGTAAIIFLIASSIIVSSGISMKHLLILVLSVCMFLSTITPVMITDVRISRFTGAYPTFDAPDSIGYQLVQSYVAFGVGGLLGAGRGQSVQKLGYLPEAHTDFIMAIIAEELG